MDSSTCFNVTFASDECKDIYPENTMSNFKVRLPREIHLNDSWRVGLADVSFNNSRYTFDQRQLIEVFSKDPDMEFEVWVTPALYDSVEELIYEINEQIRNTVYLENIPKVQLKDGKVVIKTGKYTSLEGERIVDLKFSPTLRNILGLDRWGMPFLNARQSIIFVYCSVVKQRVVGDVAAKLLRTVDPSQGKRFGSTVSQVFKRVYFCQLDVHDFSEIEIQLLDDTGKDPVFKFGSFRVTLQFRQNGSLHNTSV